MNDNNDPGWMSFMDYLGINADDLRGQYAQEKSDYDQAAGDANLNLQTANTQAMQGQYRPGESGALQVSQMASYGDFLKAKEKAAAARAQMAGVEGMDYRERALREAMGLKAPDMPDFGLQEQQMQDKLNKTRRGVLDWHQQEAKRIADEKLRQQQAADFLKQQRGGLTKEGMMAKHFYEQTLGNGQHPDANMKDPTVRHWAQRMNGSQWQGKGNPYTQGYVNNAVGYNQGQAPDWNQAGQDLQDTNWQAANAWEANRKKAKGY